MRQVVNAGLGALEIAGSLCGVPFVGAAAILLRDIVKSCDDVSTHKRKSKQVADKCVRLLNSLHERSSSLEGSELQQAVDEIVPVFEKILRRIKQWSRYNLITTYLRSNEIGNGLDACEAELDHALNLFQFNAHIALHQAQRDADAHVASNHAEMRDLLLQVLTNQRETQVVVEMQNAGQHVAEILMEAGQRELRILREHPHEFTSVSNRSLSPPPEPRDSQRYLQYQRGLINLHRITGIPPTVKILDGEVTKVGDLAVAGGTYSDIWMGTWLGEEKVALKALRNVKTSDSRAQKRFLHEITVWADLKNIHILPFYGIVTNQGQHIHMVSPWQENGNVLEYVKSFPKADRMDLISGAAQGLQYLHDRSIIHGNVKCANILVSAKGEACICDFGMSKVIEEVTERSASATLTAAGSARWLAPELIEGAITSPTAETDTYSFAMAILELLTGKQPFADRKRDASVIHDIVILKKTPPRPQKEVSVWLTDDIWDLMQSCWCKDAYSRPTMASVALRIERMMSPLDAMDVC